VNKLSKWLLGIICAAALSGCVTPGESVLDGDGGRNHAALAALKPANDAIKVDVEANADGHYHVGDPIRFKITSSKAGRLWIVSVNSENQAELLFPHGADDENTLEAGRSYLFPPRDSQQVMYAARPLGKTKLAFIITDKGGDLRDIISLKNGNLRNVSFTSDSQWGVAKLTVHVEK